jgi:hypothetical protein
MTINQLFKKTPTLDILNSLLNTYGIKSLKDTNTFSKKDLENYGTLQKIKIILPVLNDFYLPCKQKVYLKNLTTKKLITILRQFLRIFKYYLYSKEKYIKNEKIIVYQILPMEKKIIEKKNKQGGCTISFD